VSGSSPRLKIDVVFLHPISARIDFFVFQLWKKRSSCEEASRNMEDQDDAPLLIPLKIIKTGHSVKLWYDCTRTHTSQLGQSDRTTAAMPMNELDRRLLGIKKLYNRARPPRDLRRLTNRSIEGANMYSIQHCTCDRIF
jgi:hypothetical protein